MTQHQIVESEISQIADLLGSGRLSAEVQKNGERLLERINSPVRIAILGLVGSGKSELLNFLAGKKIIPPNSKIPAFELSFGSATKCEATDQNGEIKEYKGLKLDQISETNPAFVSVETDLPSLKNISLLEVALNGSIENQSTVMDWAVQRADIVIWCSQGFSKTEQTLWFRVPDRLKDHSFFVLNHADTLTSQGIFVDRLNALQGVVADEFHSLIPIATKQAIAAMLKTGGIDQDMLKASGGAALKQVILKEVSSGRRADTDSVLMFLNRHGGSAKINSDTVPQKPNSERAPSKPVDIQVASKPDVLPAVDKEPVCDEDLNVVVFEYLRKHATKLVTTSGELEPAEILYQCCVLSQDLADMLSDAQTEYSELQEDFLDAAEMLILMQLEEGVGPAADAVTLLLQLKRGLQQKMAA